MHRRVIGEAQKERAQRHKVYAVRAIEPILSAAAGDELVEIIARANSALPDTDSRKIRGHDVDMLRRLAGQARDLNAELVQHAVERRCVGERRGRVSPESANTAAWAGRLADALEPLVRDENLSEQVTEPPVIDRDQ